MNINFTILISLVIFTFVVYNLTNRSSFTDFQKIFIFFGTWGTFIICGIGGSYDGSPPQYIFYYCVYILTTSFFYILFFKIFSKLFNGLNKTHAHYSFLENKLNVYLILSITFLLMLVPLLYPQFKLYNLVNPPRLDITFFTGLIQRKNVFEKIIEYLTLIVFPFYLTSLYYFKDQKIKLILLILAPLYLRFCRSGFIGRGDLFVWILVFFSFLWIDSSKNKIKIIFYFFLLTPLFLYFFYMMGHIRSGNDYLIGENSFIASVSELVIGQTSFPTISGNIIFSNERADISEYFKWLFTTPIPKIFTGDLSGSRINFEIAYIIRGLYPGERGFTVDLTGVVTESIYIYGNYFFWVHAIFVGILFSFFSSLVINLPKCFTFVGIYFAVYWGYILSRAGIASAWPQLINAFISLYFLVLCVSLSMKNKRV